MTGPTSRLGSDGVEALGRGGSVLVDRISVTARDGHWNTLQLQRQPAADGGWRALHLDRAGRVVIDWRLSVRHDAEASVVTAHGTVLSGIELRRVGLLVLLECGPLLGGTTEIAGSTVSLGSTIAPQALIDGRYRAMTTPFDRLRITRPDGWQLALEFSERYELEDQRNWGDDTYKLYPTPLAESQPRRWSIGDQIVASVAVRTRPPTHDHVAPTPREPTMVTLRRLPTFGLQIDPDRSSAAVLARLARIPVGHLRLTSGGRPAWAERHRLELPVPVDATTLPVHHSTDRLIAMHPDGTTPTAAELAALPPTAALVAAGTDQTFAEINRHPGPPGLPVAYRVHAQTHLADTASLLRAVPVLTGQVRQALARGAGQVWVGPAGLTGGASVADPDPRLSEQSGLVWTVGAWLALTAGGARSVTLHPPLDRLLDLADGERLLEVLEGLAAVSVAGSRCRLLPTPAGVLAAVVEDCCGGRLVAANLGSSEAVLTVAGESVRLAPQEYRLQALESSSPR